MNDAYGNIALIGIDCAVQTKSIGIAVGRLDGGTVAVDEVWVGAVDPAQLITSLIKDDEPCLLAFDSPLGWPTEMGRALTEHHASDPLPIEANHLFRRETDRFVKRKIGKQSLDVGADRIARTAHAAVRLLDCIRSLTDKDISLAWNFGNFDQASCIEVYPAATLESIGLSSRGYKGNKDDHRQARTKLLDDLDGVLRLSEAAARGAIANDDAFDAAVCCLAAADFVQGHVFEPRDTDVARKEGWIWVRKP